MMQMMCPKCHGQMRQYERSGVTIDQCTECRGIFLDRGELEKLFEAEANWQRQQAAPPPPPPGQHQPGGYPPPGQQPGGYPPPAHQPGVHVPPPPQPGYPPQPAYGVHTGYHGHYRHRGYHGHPHHKRKGFLNEFFG